MIEANSRKLRVSLLIATYNRPDALEVCLKSVFHQTVLPDEIVIGDDGSGTETAQTVRRLETLSPVPIVHVWQEDKGFRLAMMRNKSAARATGDYLIEIDGDIFLHPRFIEDHLKEARPGCYVKGGRTCLGRQLTEQICLAREPRPIRWWTLGIERKSENAIHCQWLSRLLATRYRRNRSCALGCNMSFYRDDFIRINGYDEFYEGWGGEDSDLGDRLQLLGLKKRYLKFAGIVYHLWHNHGGGYMDNPRNIEYSMRCKERGMIRCTNGIDKYLKMCME